MSLYATLSTAILSGRYATGTSLPSERVLAEKYKMSRPAVREELRKLEAAGLVRSVHGSGTHVLDWMHEGTLELLPDYLASGAPGADPERLMRELLRLRVYPCCEVVRLAAEYAPPEAVDRADEAIRAAWRLRADPIEFALADLEIFRGLAGATGFPPAVWLINSALPAFRILIERFAVLVRPPADYRVRLGEVTAAVRRRRGAQATKMLTAYFHKHDRAVLRKLGLEEAA